MSEMEKPEVEASKKKESWFSEALKSAIPVIKKIAKKAGLAAVEATREMVEQIVVEDNKKEKAPETDEEQEKYSDAE